MYREVKDGKFMNKRIFHETTATSLPDLFRKLLKKARVPLVQFFQYPRERESLDRLKENPFPIRGQINRY